MGTSVKILRNWRSFVRISNLPLDYIVQDRVPTCPDLILEFQYDIITQVFGQFKTIRAYSNYFVDISTSKVLLCLSDFGIKWHIELFDFEGLIMKFNLG